MSITPPTVYAAARDPEVFLRNIDGTPAIEAAWKLSQQTVDRASHLLASAGLPPHVHTIYVAGSIGRMEQLSRSDADVVVILDDGVDRESNAGRHAFNLVWDVLEQCGLERPKSDGIFSQPDNNRHLLDPETRGLVNEDIGTFGRRIQMLLDSQPIFAVPEFESLQTEVLDRYTSSRTTPELHAEPWTYLLNDLIRYYRSLCIRTQWIDDAVQWRLINIKLRHSRFLNYAGLLLLLAEGSRRENFTTWLQHSMKWTPLERVAAVLNIHGADAKEIVNAYEIFLSSFDNQLFMSELESTTHPDSYVNDAYVELLVNSRSLATHLTRFVLNQCDRWSERFLEQFLF